MIELFDENNLPGNRVRANVVVTYETMAQARYNEDFVKQEAMQKLTRQIANEIAMKAFTMEDIRSMGAVVIKGDVVIMNPDELRHLLMDTFNRGRRHALGLGSK